MALNSTGKISLAGPTVGESIAIEIGTTANTQTSFNDPAVIRLSGLSTGSPVDADTFHGKSYTVLADVLVVGGGGYDGGDYAAAYGGGGGGGVTIANTTLSLSSSYTISVGAVGGGSSSFNGTINANGGGNSTGGYGGTSGNGYGGGGPASWGWDASTWTGAGGGGGGAAGGGGGGDMNTGTYPATPTGGTGGPGRYWSFTGLYYGAGGGGWWFGPIAGNHNGAAGIGAGNPGTGSSRGDVKPGVVIVTYVNAARLFNGGTVTSSGSGATTRWMHTFTSGGALTSTSITTYNINYLSVAGGGSGKNGGGGAGGVLSGTAAVANGSTYTITVGAGGSSGSNGANTNVSGPFFIVNSVGGGAGGAWTYDYATSAGFSGGSGGGGGGAYGGNTGPGASGVSGQGNAGGFGYSIPNPTAGGGGGGGAGGSGTNGNNPYGDGGIGIANPIVGSTYGQLVGGTYWVAGGGGGGNNDNLGGGGFGVGGKGGGGNGSGGTYGPAKTAGSYGGGGGGDASASNGANGGNGVLIISYPGSQKGIGGTVTSANGNTIHTFTTSGTFVA